MEHLKHAMKQVWTKPFKSTIVEHLKHVQAQYMYSQMSQLSCKRLGEQVISTVAGQEKYLDQ